MTGRSSKLDKTRYLEMLCFEALWSTFLTHPREVLGHGGMCSRKMSRKHKTKCDLGPLSTRNKNAAPRLYLRNIQAVVTTHSNASPGFPNLLMSTNCFAAPSIIFFQTCGTVCGARENSFKMDLRIVILVTGIALRRLELRQDDPQSCASGCCGRYLVQFCETPAR
jgi:hypothetical protein